MRLKLSMCVDVPIAMIRAGFPYIRESHSVSGLIRVCISTALSAFILQ
jgi:hypothetical protein